MPATATFASVCIASPSSTPPPLPPLPPRPHRSKATRVTRRWTAEGTRVRLSKASGTIIPIPEEALKRAGKKPVGERTAPPLGSARRGDYTCDGIWRRKAGDCVAWPEGRGDMCFVLVAQMLRGTRLLSTGEKWQPIAAAGAGKHALSLPNRLFSSSQRPARATRPQRWRRPSPTARRRSWCPTSRPTARSTASGRTPWRRCRRWYERFVHTASTLGGPAQGNAQSMAT
jgi:hypothetical protein